MSKKKHIFSCIFPVYLAIILLSIASICWIFSRIIYNSYIATVKQRLSTCAYSMRPHVEALASRNDIGGLTSLLKGVAEKNKLRLTVVARDGVVLAETSRNPVYMENHINRPEIISASGGTPCFEVRHSGTISKETMYFAIPVEREGTVDHVLRVAVTVESIDRALSPAFGMIIMFSLLVGLVALGFAFLTAKRLSLPLERLKLSAVELAKGDFSSLPPRSNIVEIDELAEAMISMSSSLQETIMKTTNQKNELKLILGNMREGVIAVDMNDDVITINAAAKQILNTGMPVAQPSHGGNLMEKAMKGPSVGLQLATNGDEPFSFRQLVRLEPMHRLVEDILRENMFLQRRIELVGIQNKIIDVHGAVLRDQNGNAIGVLLVINDITQITQLESMRKNFAANVSHELKTPLTAIKGAVETLLEGAKDSPEDSEKFLRIIEKHSDRLNALINDTMSLSKIEQISEEHTIVKETLALADVIGTSVEICREKAEKRDVSLQVDCAGSIEVTANRQMVEQALVNLVDNAVKFSPAKDVVKISAWASGKYVTIKVIDHGCGIPDEHLPRIFERFYRVDKGRSRQDGGTGLGLAIVKHIAQSHHGSVSVESVPNVETTFTLKLPV